MTAARTATAVLGLALGAMSMNLACTGLASRTSERAPRAIPLEPYLGVVPSLILTAAGHEERFLLDTAGGLTILTPRLASDLGCTPWGRVTGFRMRGDRVDVERCDHVGLGLAGTKLQIPTAGVWDLAQLLPADAPPLAGSLALDAFAGRAITLDLGADRLILETAASLKARIARATEVPVRFSREAQGLALTPLVAVPTARGLLWMELDCGSDGDVIVARHAAELVGLDPNRKGRQEVSMTLAGGIPVTGAAVVQDLILDGNLGAPLLRRWIVTLDLARQRLWISPRVGSRAG